MVLFTVTAKPAPFHWLCRICCVSSARRRFPVMVLSSTLACVPPLDHTPSAPLAQPSAVISWFTLVRSGR